jgi:sugar-phosphatase
MACSRPGAQAAVTLTAAALLLDLDGTLVDTTAAVETSWRTLAARLEVPWERFGPYLHGIPAEQVLASVVPALSRVERRRLAAEILAGQADPELPVTALPGATALTAGLTDLAWAIVTSGDRRLALSSLGKAGLPIPEVLVTADDVAVGKPDPEPFLRAAELLHVAAGNCAVIEDSPAGVTSARAAGARVIAVTTTHSSDELTAADWVVPNLATVAVGRAAGGLVLTLKECQP